MIGGKNDGKPPKNRFHENEANRLNVVGTEKMGLRPKIGSVRDLSIERFVEWGDFSSKYISSTGKLFSCYKLSFLLTGRASGTLSE